MTSSEQVREEIARVLRGAGLTDKPAEFDSSIHSWRCEYPDRYGPCDCFGELVSDLEKAILARWPVLTGVTDEMVEAGLAALRHRPGITYGVSDAVLRPITRAVLAAVLGPRDGSTR